MLLDGGIAQRVLARQPAGGLHVDVRSGAERRQGRAIRAGQLEADNVFCFQCFFDDLHGNGFHGIHRSASCAMRRSRMRRDCTPPASMLSISKRRSGCCAMFSCCASRTARSSEKTLAWPSRIVAVSASSLGLKLRAMPQKYHIDVSVSGVQKSTTMLYTLSLASAW